MAETEFSRLVADVREQLLYLQELGVTELDVEMPEFAALAATPAEKAVEVKVIPQPPPVSYSKPPEIKLPPPKVKASRLGALPSLGERPLPIPKAATLMKPAAKKDEAVVETAAVQTSALSASDASIDAIRAEIGDCTRCPLASGRKQIVHSTGNRAAELMFVGEAPGADEDEQGVPFVGRAGKLLTQIIEAIGMKREDVFIGNINRCRPPGNRPPVPAETEACRPFLLREVAVLKPKVIVVLGNTATQNLLGIKTPISKLRGNFQDYFGVKVMPTFHPAYLLRDPHKKREVWEDMKKVREYLQAN